MNIKFLRSGACDWIGLYVDGKLIHEDHDIGPTTLLRLLGIEYEVKMGSDYLEEYGNRCPEKWEEIHDTDL